MNTHICETCGRNPLVDSTTVLTRVNPLGLTPARWKCQSCISKPNYPTHHTMNTQSTMNTTQLDKDLRRMVPQWTRLLKSLKGDICASDRATDDPDDTTPGMCVTIGFTPATEDEAALWSYQTGDNSYSGGAYSHPHWAVVYLYRRSNSRELAEDAASQIADLVCQ